MYWFVLSSGEDKIWVIGTRIVTQCRSYRDSACSFTTRTTAGAVVVLAASDVRRQTSCILTRSCYCRLLLHTAVSSLRVPDVDMFQAISLAVASVPHHHQEHQEQPATNTAGSRDRPEDTASTEDASAAVVGSSWKPDCAEGGHQNLKHTPPPPYTHVVGSTTPVAAVSALPVAGDVFHPSGAGGDAGTATQQEECKVSPSSASSPKSWSDATAESGASAQSSGKDVSSASSAPIGTRDDLGPWKFSQSAGVHGSTSGEASGSKVSNPLMQYYVPTGISYRSNTSAPGKYSISLYDEILALWNGGGTYCASSTAFTYEYSTVQYLHQLRVRVRVSRGLLETGNCKLQTLPRHESIGISGLKEVCTSNYSWNYCVAAVQPYRAMPYTE